jgi:hypothetical protein
MEVVEGMPVAGDAKPVTWGEARGGSEPAEVVRGQRSLTVEYRHHGDRWTATSPDLDGFEVTASTLPQLKADAHTVLDDWLDPSVQVNAIVIDEAEPQPTTRPKSRIKASSRRMSAMRLAATLGIKSKLQGRTGRPVSKRD